MVVGVWGIGGGGFGRGLGLGRTEETMVEIAN
jgi:hypothetical protein